MNQSCLRHGQKISWLILAGALAMPRAQAADAGTVVAADGSANFTSVQAAVNAVPVNGTQPFVILLKPGTYREHVVVSADRPFITLRGEPDVLDKTIITGGLNFKTPGPNGSNLSARDSATVLVQAHDFSAENITFENTTTHDDHVQALAMYVEADRAVFRRCRFLGWQDTLRADAARGKIGRQYFTDCYIEGHVDFIYAAGTAVFDRCHIHCRADGYITAASTAAETPFGFVFLDCQVTAAPEAKRVYLGRPWRPYAATAFIRCALPAAIAPEGWHNWGKADNERTARYVECANTGPGANPGARVKWERSLTAEEARAWTAENSLRGADGWNPVVPAR